MFLVGLISWWYGDGFKRSLSGSAERLASTYDFFSISIILKTLFSPFRQISAGKVGGDFGSLLRGLVDKLISRTVGFVVRLFTLIAGVVALTGQLAGGVIVTAVWLVTPVIPVVGFILMALGWTPAWQ